MKKNIMLALRYCTALALMLLLMAVLPAPAQTTTTYTVPEAAEANKLYTSTNGAAWKDKQGWPLQMTYTTTTNTRPTVSGVIFANSVPQLLIQRLQLDNNQLRGTIPNFNLPNLQGLALLNNKLSGTIPNFNLPNLQWLYLDNDQLSGTIPNFNLPNLLVLSLESNQLSGTIPNFDLPNLQALGLFGNQLSGTIPNFNLPNLIVLSLSSNQLSGTIPNFNLRSLQSLYLDNNQLSGTIPNFNLRSLQSLGLSSNQLSGAIPNFSLSDLQSLDLAYNQLSGMIPNFSLLNLQSLRLESNQLSGTIPNFILPNLQALFLSNNQLSGTIPNFKLLSLKALELQNNQLSGCDVDWTKVPKLFSLRLDRNKLVFRDLEPAAKAMQGKTGVFFSYSPQDSVTTFKSNDTVRVDVGGEQTRYQWFRNGVAIINATQASYKTTDTALYSCRSTNSLLPDLTLYSRPVRGGTVITSVLGTHLFQNGQTADIITALRIHPNPFREQGSISYRLTSKVSVSIAVYSLLGQKLFTVFEGEQAAGTHVQELNMSAVSAGAYIVRMQAGASAQSVVVHYVR